LLLGDFLTLKKELRPGDGEENKSMNAFQLISGIEFNGTSQDSDDLWELVAENEVNDAIARGEVPHSPINSAVHELHPDEEAVQKYLAQHRLKAGTEYQSVFVGFGAATAVDQERAKRFGHPFLVRPEVVQELSVASLGDLQSVVDGLTPVTGNFPADDRIVGLENALDRTESLKQLCLRAQAHNARTKSNFIYVEARLNRPWSRTDLVRPCRAADFYRANLGERPLFRIVNRSLE
jgi:hypothetical protein